MQITKEYLLKYGFIQDEEDSSCYWYKGIPYDITDDRDISEVKYIIDYIIYNDTNDIEFQKKSNEAKKREYHDIIIPTHNDLTTNLSSGAYSYMTKLLSKSNFKNIGGKEMEAYLYDNVLKVKLEELKAEGIKIPSKNTIKKYMKTFERITIDGDNFHLMDVINTPKGICYQFKQSYQGKYFITIPSPMLRELMEGANDKVIKLYCVIARKLQLNNDYTKFTREYLCNGMGIEPIESNMQYISRQLTVLKKLGHIKVEYDWIKEKTDAGNIMKQVMYIKLTTFEEWEELTKINERTNKKTKK